MSFDEQPRSVHLNATPEDWQTVSHSYELSVKSLPANSSELSSLMKRDFSYQTPLSMDWALPKPQYKVDLFDMSNISVTCDYCGTHGKFDIDLRVETVLEIPISATLLLTTSGVSVEFAPKLTVTVMASPKVPVYFVNLKEPLSPIAIPGIGTVGPELLQKIGFEFSGLQASSSLSTGIVAKVTDGATLAFDLLPILLSPGILTRCSIVEGVGSDGSAERCGADWRDIWNFETGLGNGAQYRSKSPQY